MKTFLQWCEDEKLKLPLIDVDRGEEATSEDSKRTGYSPHYPAAYKSGQYPHKYFNAGLSTADLEKQNIDAAAKRDPALRR